MMQRHMIAWVVVTFSCFWASTALAQEPEASISKPTTKVTPPSAWEGVADRNGGVWVVNTVTGQVKKCVEGTNLGTLCGPLSPN